MDSKTLLWAGIAALGFALIGAGYMQIAALRADVDSLRSDINLNNEVGAMSTEDREIFREYD